MAEIEISKIKINETNLNIKDSIARNNILSLSTNIQNNITSLSTNIQNNYLPLSGGTLTRGVDKLYILNLKNSNIDAMLDSVDTTRYTYIQGKDKNDRNMGYLYFGEASSDGRTVIKISAQKPYIKTNSNGTTTVDYIENGLTLRTYANGTRSVGVTDQTIWRNALGASTGVWPVATGGTGITTATSNLVFATPNNASGAPKFRALVANDLPNFSTTKITSGSFSVAHGGTGRATLTSNAVLAGNGTSAVKMIASASGALYATGANGALQFGTLPIAQGGTGGGGDDSWQIYDATSKSSVFNGKIYYRKLGVITVISSDSLTLSNDLTISSGVVSEQILPDIYRPAVTTDFLVTTTREAPGTVRIRTDGKLQFYKKRTVSTMLTTDNFYVNCSFINT